jgi:hypothetical protein
MTGIAARSTVFLLPFSTLVFLIRVLMDKLFKVNQILIFLKNKGIGRLVELNESVSWLSQQNMFTFRLGFPLK